MRAEIGFVWRQLRRLGLSRTDADVRRALQRRREVGPERRSEPLLDGPLPDEVLERRRARAVLDELLVQLPEELARVLVLTEVEQLTMAAIAELEGIPAGTVASRLRRARSALRELLEQHPCAKADGTIDGNADVSLSGACTESKTRFGRARATKGGE